METIGETFKWRSLTLLSRVAECRHLVQHNGLFGENNEGLLVETLRDYLDESWSIGSGEIIDVEGKRSPQCDVIIYNPRMLPRAFRSSLGRSIILAHAVGAVIEVKTSITAADGKNGTTVETVCDQIAKVGDFLDAAIEKGNKRLRNRNHAEVATQFQSETATVPVMTFCYSSDVKAGTLHAAMNKHFCGSRSSAFVLDVRRDAQEVRQKFSGIEQRSKDEILAFVDEFRMPNGYQFKPIEFVEKSEFESKNIRHMEMKRLGSDCLRIFVKELFETLRNASPGRISLAPEHEDQLYSAYNSWEM